MDLFCNYVILGSLLNLHYFLCNLCRDPNLVFALLFFILILIIEGGSVRKLVTDPVNEVLIKPIKEIFHRIK